MTSALSTDLLVRLQSFDTPTVCNAIEVAMGQRGFANFTRAPLRCSHVSDRPVVGFARTAKIAGCLPSTEDRQTVELRRRDYYRYMAKGMRPGLAVIEDMDGADAIGAWWGEIHAQVHSKVCSLSGALTNGLMRDLGDLPAGFPIFASALGPSHGWVHVREFGTPVSVFGMQVNEGDLIHCDQHGALVVPPELIPHLSSAIEKLHHSEAIILEPIRKGALSMDEFETHWAAFMKARIG